MKNLINQLLRGVVIGVANIIPGVSGGTMMVSMGIYDTLIHCITHLFKEFKKSIKTLLPYAVGMLVGILALASVINWGLENHPLPTNTLFIGLILGGLGPLLKKVDRKKINAAAVIAFVALFALIIWLGVQRKESIQNAETINMDALQVLIMVFIGMIASATMIIPGVSGSLVLMLLGYYKPVVNALSTLKDGLFSFNFSIMGQPVLMLLPFLLGIVLGIFGVAKLIEWLTARFPTPTYCGVLGLVVASPISLLIQTDLSGVSAVTVIISVVTLAAGFAGAYLLAKGSKE
jgi:putative membrane protein